MQVLFVGFAKTARYTGSETVLEGGGQSGKFRNTQPLAPDIGGQPGGLDGPAQRVFGQAAAEGGGEAVEERLAPLEQQGKLEIAHIPEGCGHNAHMFWIKLRDLEERTAMIAYLKEHDIYSMFHYVPLHSAEAGLKFGRFAGKDVYTTKESNRLTRLPMYYGLTEEEVNTVVETVKGFWR